MSVFNSHAGWHQIMHFLFALANLGVLVFSSYHIARYDGYGFYSFDTDKLSGGQVWDYTDESVQSGSQDQSVQSASYPKLYDDTLGKTCESGGNSDDNKYNNWVAENPDFTWYGFKQSMELLENSKRFHVDIGNPIDKVILEIDDINQFPVCVKADNHDASDHHASMQICAVMEHDDDQENGFAQTRMILIMLLSFSAVFFILEILYIINMMHARGAVRQYMVNDALSEGDPSLRQQKEDRLYHRVLAHGGSASEGFDATVDIQEKGKEEVQAIMEYAKGTGWSLPFKIFHVVMYSTAIILSAIFLGYVKDTNDNDKHFDFTTVAEYNKDADCFKDPYAPAVKLALSKLKNDDVTDELSSAYGIVSIYLVISAVCAGFYVYFIVNSMKSQHEDARAIQGTSLNNIGDAVNSVKSTGRRVADGLFKRGKEIVNLQF